MKGLYDLKLSITNLYKDYGYSFIVISTLGLTLAISLFLFTIIYSIEYKSLPMVKQSKNLAWGTMYTSGRPYIIGGLSNYNYLYLQQHQTTLEDFGRIEERGVTLSDVQFTEQLKGAAVTSNMFSMLGVQPVLGQLLQERDDLPGASKRVVISYRVWETLFDKAKDVSGKTVKLDGQITEIIGVMPADFRFPIDHDVWFVDASVDLSVNDHGGWNSVYGRIKPGFDVEDVDSEFKRLMSEMVKEFPNEYKGKDIEVISFTKRFSESRRFLLTLLKISAFAILIMGCFSVSNLIIVRNLEKSKEVVIKTALGVPAIRIVTGLLLETFWLCMLSLVIGIWVCYLAVDFFGKGLLGGPYWWELKFQFPILVCAIISVLFLWLATSFVPAWMVSRQPTNSLLSSGRKGGTSNKLNHVMFGFSAAQIFSSFVLCVFTGVLLSGLLKIANADYGVPREGYLVAEVKLSGDKYSELHQRNEYYERFVDQASLLQGVDGVGVINALPGSGGYLSTYTSVERNIEMSGGYPKANETPIGLTYLDVMDIELIEGRNFTSADTSGAEEVAIINKSMADILFPGESAVGRQFQYDPEKGGHLITVVGVVQDVVSNNPLWYFSPASKDWRSQLYRPIAQKQPAWSPNTLIFKVDGNPYDFVTRIKSIGRDIDSEIPLYKIKSYDDFLTENESGFRRMILTFAPAALLSLVISALGLFTITRRVTLQNIPDIGIMRAIGVPEIIINMKFIRSTIVQWVLVAVCGTLFSVMLLPALPSSILITNNLTILFVCFVCSVTVGLVVFVANYIPLVEIRNIQPRDAMNYLCLNAE